LSAFMFLLSLVSIGGAFATSIIIYTNDTFVPQAGISIPIWLGFSAGTDCLIAISLVVALLRMQSGLKSSESLIRKIIYMTVQTGLATSVLAIIGLGTLVARLGNNTSTVFGFTLGSAYSLTMLHNLNHRKSLSRSNPSSDLQGEPGSLGLNLTQIMAVYQHTPPRSDDGGFELQRYRVPTLATGTSIVSSTDVSEGAKGAV
jgi:hypothetical protein